MAGGERAAGGEAGEAAQGDLAWEVWVQRPGAAVSGCSGLSGRKRNIPKEPRTGQLAASTGAGVTEAGEPESP